MAQTVFGFKIVFSKNVIVRHMAVIAVCHLAVCAMVPGSVLRHHDMAIDTRFGIVGQIRGGLGDFENKQDQTYKDPYQNNNRDFPLIGRGQYLNNIFYFQNKRLSSPVKVSK